ncbi:MAG: type I restriction enzyme HsdR N-terminal domain-containing protein [Ekhidna sp.]|nr:type I restriction enzyme HsdR N-terminal domain-containing protein [Ekhidna sp.]
MHQLKLPDFDHRVEQDKIFCLIRKKWVALTPEEWVRQHFLNLMIVHLGYPKGLFKLEHTLQYFKNQKRSDITVLDRVGEVYMLVECKSADVKLGNDVVGQLATYNKVMDAKFLSITNGLATYVWKKGVESYEQVSQFPSYEV